MRPSDDERCQEADAAACDVRRGERRPHLRDSAERRHRAHGPYPDQPHILAAADLVGQQRQLRENRHQQHRQVAVAIEEKLHGRFTN